MDNQVHSGVVSYFDTHKHFGFIESDNNSYFFFIDTEKIKELNKELKKQGKPKIKLKFQTGDEVNFKLRFLDNEIEAYDLEYFGNSHRQSLINEAEEKTVLLGYLKKIKDKFFVKHISTYIFVPVKFSKYEIDIASVYEGRLNQLVQFQLINTNEIDKLKAVLTDRRYCYDWGSIQNIFENQEVVSGYIKQRKKGGFIVETEEGIDAFLPGGQIDMKPIRDYDSFVGKKMDFKIVQISRESENVVLSHKILIQEKIEEQRKQTVSKLEKGQLFEGVVKNITNYGIFVEFEGVTGLIHISDLKREKINNPHKIAVIGDKIKVIVIDFKEDKTRIQLGYVQNTD